MSEVRERRPPLCLDKTAEVLWWSGSSKAQEEGYSWECIGKLSRPHSFVWNEVTHVNQYCHCLYTPLKGITKFLESAVDARGTWDLMARLLRDASPLECCICGSKGFLGEYWELDGKGYCPFCMVKSGKVKWDEGANVWLFQI